MLAWLGALWSPGRWGTAMPLIAICLGGLARADEPVSVADVIVAGERCPIVQDPSAVLPAVFATEFSRYRRFLQRCPVAQPGSHPVMFVVSVQVNNYYTSRPGIPPAEAIPKPVLVLPDNAVVGRLPAAFPDNGPVTATLRFGSWHARWPGTLRIDFESDAVAPPKPITMKFDPETRLFATEEPRR